MRSFLCGLVFPALLMSAGGAQAETPRIYDGITQGELIAFAKGQGWEAEPWSGARAVRLRIHPNAAETSASAILYMTHCDAADRCRAGLLRSMSYYFIKQRDFFWHWNQTHLGATGFSENYVTLQRYLHFRGVTDTYLKEVIGEMWAGASARFWADVAKAAADEWRRNKTP